MLRLTYGCNFDFDFLYAMRAFTPFVLPHLPVVRMLDMPCAAVHLWTLKNGYLKAGMIWVSSQNVELRIGRLMSNGSSAQAGLSWLMARFGLI